MERCRYCRQPIKWARTERGKAMPLDPDPTEEGNVELVNGVAVVLGGLDLYAARESNTVLHISHFATCPSPFNPANQKRANS